jgi:glycerol-3-phosphate acyltransferase PlsY
MLLDLYVGPSLWQAAIVFALGGFVAGSIPFGWLAARAKGIDLHAVGSGNIGATNAWRALGWKWGLAVMLLDMLKGLLPVVLWFYWSKHYAFETGWLNDYTSGLESAAWLAHIKLQLKLFPMVVGIAAMLGHTFTPWLKFKGGKGVATGLGVVIALFQWWTLVPLVVFGIVLGLSRIVSLSSIAALITLAIVILAEPLYYAQVSYIYWPRTWFFPPSVYPYWPFAVAITLLVLWTHRDNIRRIIDGTEPRIGGGKAQAA